MYNQYKFKIFTQHKNNCYIVWIGALNTLAANTIGTENVFSCRFLKDKSGIWLCYAKVQLPHHYGLVHAVLLTCPVWQPSTKYAILDFFGALQAKALQDAILFFSCKLLPKF